MKTRHDLAKYFNELGFKLGAEIGVFDGYYSEILCKNIADLKLYSIDAWKTYTGYKDHKLQSSMNKAHTMAIRRLKPYDCKIIKKFSIDAVNDFKDRSLDFVYIDGNHEYNYIKQDIEQWSEKVRKGGIVAGHDYNEVAQAVNEYTENHKYILNIIPYYPSIERVDDKQSNWFFHK